MGEKVYLLNFKVSGIKNLEKTIELNFYKKTIDKQFDPEKYRIKAIYGENGSGKTAIVVGMDVLRNIIIDSTYLNDSKNQQYLQAMVNKKTRRIELNSDFIYYTDAQSRIYSYEVSLGLNPMGLFEIERESLKCRFNGTRAKEIVVFECLKGEINSVMIDDEETKDRLIRESLNLLGKQSLAINCLLNSKDIFRNNMSSPFRMMMFDLYFFAAKINVCIASEDDPDLYLQKKELLEAKDPDDFFDKITRMVSTVGRFANANEKLIAKDLFENYKLKIKKLERFIQLFKRDLKSIDIDKTEAGEFFACKLLMNYGDYRVDTVFESTGITKLIKLFDYLNSAADGEITFIDEMDANINDVYLSKIIDYFMQYGKGQLCFTTHNTSPMASLRSNKKSIAFLSSDNQIVEWKTNGNFAPDKLYRQGMIEYLPFNIEPEDFLGVLGE